MIIKSDDNRFMLFKYLKQLILTEKTVKLINKKQYIFEINPKLTKKQIKKIFEKNYNIKIKSINTYLIKNQLKLKKRAILHFSDKIQIV
uniref:Large ribosomal subunit protein uL23c n=1 Tax=Callipsygma wilsonis TaxID=2320807 RepID=A0A386B000_9CHLO|nr:ribosomal protein L23 [Callipsygma wilsonis]AYC65028.1 ribosomal protein L23 [Callipsygma wilsonis]